MICQRPLVSDFEKCFKKATFIDLVYRATVVETCNT